MKYTIPAIALAAGLLSVTGAQAANAPLANAQATPSYAKPVIADADAMKAADTLQKTNLRQQLQDQLAKAGYTAIKVTPSSFYIQAKDKKGEPVAMVIGPDSFAEVTEVTASPSMQPKPQPQAAIQPNGVQKK